MILFWVICALLIVIALAFVLPPALQHSEDVASDDMAPITERARALHAALAS